MHTAFREVICGGFVVHPEILKDQLREDLKADQAFTKSLSIDTMRY